MNGRKNASPSPTQPRKRNGSQISQRGMLSLAMSLVSLVALGIAMLGGAKLAYDVLANPEGANTSLFAAVIALGITYVVGWLTAMVAIRVYGNLILPILINLIMWACLAGICYLYVEILLRLYGQEYDFWRYWKYVLVMLAGLTVLVGLHLVIEGHNLRPFAIPLLFVSLIQLGVDRVPLRVHRQRTSPLYLWRPVLPVRDVRLFSLDAGARGPARTAAEALHELLRQEQHLDSDSRLS
jgi:hypothetical protein